jgi:5,10-methylenetetrahydromethanopterin reductase
VVTLVRFSLALEADKSLEDYRRCLALAKKYDFYSFQIYEHISYRPAWSILFQIAATEKKSKKIAIGPVTIPVLLSYPFYMAANAAALCDSRCGAKVVLGISRGAFYDYLGVPKHSRPITAVKEAVEIVETVIKKRATSYRGQVFSFSGGLKWRFKPNVEIYVGSSGPKMIETASKMPEVKGVVVDNLWNPTYAKKVKHAMELGRANIDSGIRDIQLIARPFSVIVPRESASAKKIAVKELAKYSPYLLKGSPMVKEAGSSDEELEFLLGNYFKNKNARERVDTIIESFVAIGTPVEIIEQTDNMLKSGVTHICYGHPLGPKIEESINLIGKKVIPYFRNYNS